MIMVSNMRKFVIFLIFKEFLCNIEYILFLKMQCKSIWYIILYDDVFFY